VTAAMQSIYQMNHVRAVRSGKVVLDDVTLAFLPGVKVRIMAGRVCP
jgi:ABC-type molybdenum transport system ATPase subunit/photorepair protein PhrA